MKILFEHIMNFWYAFIGKCICKFLQKHPDLVAYSEESGKWYMPVQDTLCDNAFIQLNTKTFCVIEYSYIGKYFEVYMRGQRTYYEYNM